MDVEPGHAGHKESKETTFARAPFGHQTYQMLCVTHGVAICRKHTSTYSVQPRLPFRIAPLRALQGVVVLCSSAVGGGIRITMCPPSYGTQHF